MVYEYNNDRARAFSSEIDRWHYIFSLSSNLDRSVYCTDKDNCEIQR